jgi:hypothetical protein
VAAANTQPPPAGLAPASPAKANDTNAKKDDIDGMLDRVPQGLRKKFGF